MPNAISCKLLPECLHWLTSDFLACGLGEGEEVEEAVKEGYKEGGGGCESFRDS